MTQIFADRIKIRENPCYLRRLRSPKTKYEENNK